MYYAEQLFQHPFSCIVAGPSKAGKTVFVSKFLKHVDYICSTSPAEIIWAFAEYQPHYRELACNPRVRLCHGIPAMTQLKQNVHIPKLLVFDDLMNEFKRDETLVELFTKGVHHWNISCIHVVQNIFFGGLRTARINAHYLVLFKNPSDKSQVSALARQIYPGKSRQFIEAYQSSTAQPFTYLLIDMSQNCPEELRLRTNIFPGEVQFVYCI